MKLVNHITPLPLITFDASVVNDTTYTAINPAGLPLPCAIVRIINQSDHEMWISTNKLANHFWILRGTTLQLDAQQEHMPSNGVALFPAGTIFYAIDDDPLFIVVGNLYVTGYSSYTNT